MRHGGSGYAGNSFESIMAMDIEDALYFYQRVIDNRKEEADAIERARKGHGD